MKLKRRCWHFHSLFLCFAVGKIPAECQAWLTVLMLLKHSWLQSKVFILRTKSKKARYFILLKDFNFIPAIFFLLKDATFLPPSWIFLCWHPLVHLNQSCKLHIWLSHVCLLQERWDTQVFGQRFCEADIWHNRWGN